MLFVTGQFKGKNVEMQLVSAEDLLSEFGIKKKERVAFKYHPNVTRYDPLNKIVKKPARIGPGPEFRGIHPNGGEVMIRFAYRTPTKNPKTGHYRNDPNNLFFHDNMLLKWSENADLIAWFLLHPSCADSPIRRKGEKASWMLDDREAAAQKEFAKVNKTMDLMQEISGETDELKLRRIALALKGKLRINNPASMGLNELKASLGKKAMEHPEEFEYAYRDTATMMRGIISHAIRSGLTVQRNAGGGQTAIHWKDDINAGALICRVPAGSNVVEHLVGYLSDETRFVPFMETVSGNLNHDIKHLAPLMDSVKKDISDMTAIELVALAEREDAIQYQHGKGVVILNNYVPEEPALHKVENAARWREEFRKAIEEVDIKRNRLVKRLKDGPKEPEADQEGPDQTEKESKKAKK